MHEINQLNLDARTLNAFLRVYDTGSVTEAAAALGLNQSSVSHALARLRKTVGDPLFVKSGRTIAPTAHAHLVAEEVREILSKMRGLASQDEYDPSSDTGSFAVAANDYEISVLLPTVFRSLRAKAPLLKLEIIQPVALENWGDFLRRDEVDLALAPRVAGDESDLVHQRLFSDQILCFFDRGSRTPPLTLESYCAVPHAILAISKTRETMVDRALAKLGHERRVVLSCPNFTLLSVMVRNTNLVVTLPSLLRHSFFEGFAVNSPPIDLPRLQIDQIWHVRNNSSHRHRWFRRLFRDAAAQLRKKASANLEAASF